MLLLNKPIEVPSSSCFSLSMEITLEDVKTRIRSFYKGTISSQEFELFTKNLPNGFLISLLFDSDPVISYCSSCIILQNICTNSLIFTPTEWNYILKYNYFDLKVTNKLIQAHIYQFILTESTDLLREHIQSIADKHIQFLYLKQIPNCIKSKIELKMLWQETVYPFLISHISNWTNFEIISSWSEFDFITSDISDLFTHIFSKLNHTNLDCIDKFCNLLISFPNSFPFYKYERIFSGILHFITGLPIEQTNTSWNLELLMECYIAVGEHFIGKIASGIGSELIQKFISNMLFLFEQTLDCNSFEFWITLQDSISSSDTSQQNPFLQQIYYRILQVIIYQLDLVEANEELESLLLLIFDLTEDKFIESFEERINVDFIKCLQIFSLIYKKKNPKISHLFVRLCNHFHTNQLRNNIELLKQFLTIFAEYLPHAQIDIPELIISDSFELAVVYLDLPNCFLASIKCISTIIQTYPYKFSFIQIQNLLSNMFDKKMLTENLMKCISKWAVQLNSNDFCSLLALMTNFSSDFNFILHLIVFIDSLILDSSLLPLFHNECKNSLFPRISFHFQFVERRNLLFLLLKCLAERVDDLEMLNEIYSISLQYEIHCEEFYQLICFISTIITVHFDHLELFFIQHFSIEDSVELLQSIGTILLENCTLKFIECLVFILENSSDDSFTSVSCSLLEKILKNVVLFEGCAFQLISTALKICLVEVTSDETFQRISHLLFQLNLTYPRQFPAVIRQFTSLTENNPHLLRSITGQRQLDTFRKAIRKIKL